MEVFLRVPYPERRQAKALGAHYSRSRKKWYVVDTRSFYRCQHWAPPITPEIREWLESVPAEYARALSKTVSTNLNTTSREPDRVVRIIASEQKQRRASRRARQHTQSE